MITVQHIYRHLRIVRFVISGGTTAVVSLVALYILTDILAVWYLLSSAIAFCIGLVVNFTLQKLWTFQDTEREQLGRKLMLFLLVSLGHLMLNTFFMYALVEWLSVWYLAAQCIVMLALALVTYRIYKQSIFTPTERAADANHDIT